MKIFATSILFPVLALLAAIPSAAQEEDHSTLRGLKAPPYTVVLDQDIVNPGVFYGSGNTNGNWVIATSTATKAGKQVSVALRAHAAYAGLTEPNPDKPFEFIYDTGPGPASSKAKYRPKWNYDFSINSDVTCPKDSPACTPLSTYVYEVAMDVNPTIGTTWIKVDPINQPYADHFFGKFDTTSATDLQIQEEISSGVPNTNRFQEYANVIKGVTIHEGGRLHVAQNSFSYAFLVAFGFPNFNVGARNSYIDKEGIYDVVFSIKEKSGKLLAKAAIRVLVKDPSLCGGVNQGKCFPDVASDCSTTNIKQFYMFFTSKQTKECLAFVEGIKQ